MERKLQYRQRVITDSDVAFIRQLLREHPAASRRELSKKLCQAWNWVQPNGALRDMVCRGLLLALHRAGWIQLPAKRKWVPNNVITHRRPRTHDEPVDQSPLVASLAELGPLRLEQVRRNPGEALWTQ